ncbi:MAG TPA: hypothetical protein VHL79_23410 [Ramlibacter sp.]|jgi:hypothetical protein|nr:hypothetical protein [Ramlibacter sp.]
MKKSVVALVLAPSIALGVQSLMYAMVTPSCSSQVRLNIHLAAAIALAIVVVLALVAYGESSLHRGEPVSADSDEAHTPVPGRFVADLAAAVGALSALVIVAMWFTTFVLSPCDIL